MPTKTSIHLETQISKIQRFLVTQIKPALVHCGINYSEWLLLKAIVIDGITKPSVVADELKIERATISRLIESLEVSGLIKREYSRDDRRIVILTATKKAHKAVALITKKSDQLTTQLIADGNMQKATASHIVYCAGRL